MTAIYDITALATSAKERVRFMIGDTDIGTTAPGPGAVVRQPMIQDEEIAIEVTRSAATAAPSGADTLVAIRCLRRIVSRLKTETDQSGAGVSSSRSQRFNQAKDALKLLESEGFAQSRIVRKGNSIAAQQTIAADLDYIPPPFSIGMDDNNS